jgi:hypothetical protein
MAPAMRFSCSASTSAVSSTTGPRPTLMSQALFFIRAMRSRSKRWRVSGVSGQARTTKSLALTSVPRSAGQRLGRQALEAALAAEDPHAEAAPRDARDARADRADADDADGHAGDLVGARAKRAGRIPVCILQ